MPLSHPWYCRTRSLHAPMNYAAGVDGVPCHLQDAMLLVGTSVPSWGVLILMRPPFSRLYIIATKLPQRCSRCTFAIPLLPRHCLTSRPDTTCYWQSFASAVLASFRNGGLTTLPVVGQLAGPLLAQRPTVITSRLPLSQLHCALHLHARPPRTLTTAFGA